MKERSHPLSICIAASAFHPSLGGVEELCRQLAHEYQRRGWRVCVLTNRWPRSLPRKEVFEGIPVYRVAMRTPDAGFKSQMTYWLTSWFVEREVANMLREERVDLVHVQCVGGNGHYARKAAQRLGLPLIVSLQGELTMDATRLFERSAFARSTMRAALEGAHFVTACSQQTLTEAEQFFRQEIPNSAVVHNGIRAADFADVKPESRPRPYILCMGRHVAQKGFDVLIRAVALLEAKGHADFDLVVAGDGPETDSLMRLADELGLRERVSFPGRASRAQAGALLAGCELFVLPSRHEPFGIVNLEAMACGVPVVATRTGGVPEFVEHAVSGWLVPSEDPAALADAVSRVLQDAELRDTLVANGRRVATEHDWSYLANSYETLYRGVCQETSR